MGPGAPGPSLVERSLESKLQRVVEMIGVFHFQIGAAQLEPVTSPKVAEVSLVSQILHYLVAQPQVKLLAVV